MDFELMISSLPKLLSASVITLKLLSVSLIIGLFIGLLFAILRLNKNIFINKYNMLDIIFNSYTSPPILNSIKSYLILKIL
mgnify:CR=1 FL=1